MKRVAILGSTGSVGTQALDILAPRGETFAAVALTAHRSEGLLVEQAGQFGAKSVCLVEGDSRPAGLDPATSWHTGADGILEALEASQPDVVLNGITGAAGLAASEWTLRRGLPLALANKESLVVAGEHLMALAQDSGSPILPVDSEHCAVFQCLRGENRKSVRRIYLTASGGPFRTTPLSEFGSIRPQDALRHPTWEMGPRITVGSATMMNKAFEVLEARWLFGLDPEQIEVVIHPQSIVHSMVEFVDGSMMAQLGLPDMRVPILYCLAYPDRIPFEFEPFDLAKFSTLAFEAVDPARFPAVPLAFECLQRGGDSGAILNGADEVLTARFLAGDIPFASITPAVAQVLRQRDPRPIRTLADVTNADAEARRDAGSLDCTQP